MSGVPGSEEETVPIPHPLPRDFRNSPIPWADALGSASYDDEWCHEIADGIRLCQSVRA